MGANAWTAPFGGGAPCAAAALLALLSGYAWGPLIDAPIGTGIVAALVAFVLGLVVAVVGARLRGGAAQITVAVVTVVVVANFAVFVWAVSQAQ